MMIKKIFCLLVLSLFLHAEKSYAKTVIADGTLMYVWNGNAVVQEYTSSKVTHVGLIINSDGHPYLYEADVPEVRKIKFSDYLKQVSSLNTKRSVGNKIEIYLIQPHIPYTEEQVLSMKKYLDGKIGTRYSIRSYVHKKPQSSGMHCAELVLQSLNSSGRYVFSNPSAVTPKAISHHMVGTYGDSQQVVIHGNQEYTWRNWIDRTFTWCGWSCKESGIETLYQSNLLNY